MKWYRKITSNPDDLTPLVDAVLFFEKELEIARHETRLEGRVEKASARLSGVMSHRYGQLQEIESILRYLEIKMTKVKGKAYKMYLEGYNRTLSSRDAEKYADADDDVIEVAMLINQVSLLRNSYHAITKGLDVMQYQIGHLVRLKCAGLEDYDITSKFNDR